MTKWETLWYGFKQILPEPFEETIEIDSRGVTRRLSGGRVETVLWAELEEVAILTAARGLWLPEVVFLLRGRNHSGVAIESEKANQVGLLSHLKRLPGFDDRALSRARGSCHDRSFLCWRRGRSPVRFATPPGSRE